MEKKRKKSFYLLFFFSPSREQLASTAMWEDLFNSMGGPPGSPVCINVQEDHWIRQHNKVGHL